MTRRRWPLRPLGDCAKFLSGGTPSKARTEFWEGDIPWISSGEMTEIRIHDSSLHITSEAAEDGSRLVPENTVLAVVRGMSLAKEFRVSITKREVAFNQDLKAFACKPDVDPEFLFYALFVQREHIRQLATEASHGTKKLETDTLARVGIPLPKLTIQQRTVQVACTYDELIENNRRRMGLLEKSARLLYEEWFVRLRFPGHEHTPITHGIPQGWERKTLAELVEVQSGFAFKSGTYESSGLHGIVTIKNVQDGDFLPACDAFLNEPPENMSKDCHLRTGDILLSLTGNIGRCCLVVGENYLLNQRVAKLLPALCCPRAFVYVAFRSERMRKQLEAISHGVAQQNLSPVKMVNLPFVIPSVALLRQFSEIVEPILDQVLVLKEQNQKLRAARDLLLPRLMSGEIEV